MPSVEPDPAWNPPTERQLAKATSHPGTKRERQNYIFVTGKRVRLRNYKRFSQV